MGERILSACCTRIAKDQDEPAGCANIGAGDGRLRWNGASEAGVVEPQHLEVAQSTKLRRQATIVRGRGHADEVAQARIVREVEQLQMAKLSERGRHDPGETIVRKIQVGDPTVRDGGVY